MQEEEGRHETERTWKPKAAGILCIIVGAIAVVISCMAGVLLVDPLMTSEEATQVIILALGQGIILILVSFPLFMFGTLAIVGGISASRRRRWGLALAGSISALIFGIITNYIAHGVFGAWFSLPTSWLSWLLLALVVCGILGLLALIFVIRGRREFK